MPARVATAGKCPNCGSEQTMIQVTNNRWSFNSCFNCWHDWKSKRRPVNECTVKDSCAFGDWCEPGYTECNVVNVGVPFESANQSVKIQQEER
jgi:Zn ribbon nucleic-acid-binding protein